MAAPLAREESETIVLSLRNDYQLLKLAQERAKEPDIGLSTLVRWCISSKGRAGPIPDAQGRRLQGAWSRGLPAM